MDRLGAVLKLVKPAIQKAQEQGVLAEYVASLVIDARYYKQMSIQELVNKQNHDWLTPPAEENGNGNG